MTRRNNDNPRDDDPRSGPGGGSGDASSFHDMPTAADPAPSAPPLPAYTGMFSGLHEGTKVPGYTIRQMLGEGGMGAVYLAEQAKPRRTVALKIIRPDRVSAATLKRFDYEAQLLASLRHPGIAAMYEVGSFELDGLSVPYFAMEYIEGARSLTEYARIKQLGVQERLELFLRVCDAVQHGHQQGVIHRDLKP
ncbi:MAG: protein kinase, partial [Phycisphaerales bacterium]|nr:protein kinase [Phycisphaerales bacterium]